MEAEAPRRMTRTERDRTRKRHGQQQRKRLKVLRNPNKVAFRGWQDIPDPWTMETCATYIEWCHIDKAFPEERHNYHRRFHKANLQFCTDDAFKQRCIEVYQVLYDRPTVERNEVQLFVARGVHAEVRLQKRVDWSTVQERGNKIKVPHPTSGFIPMGVLRFPAGGLGPLRTIIQPPADTYETSSSSPDDDSDGARTPPQPPTARREQRAKKRRARQMTRNEEVLEEVPPTTDEMGPQGMDERAAEAMDEEENVLEGEEVLAAAIRISNLENDLNDKINEIRDLYADTHKLKTELEEKNKMIQQQSEEIAQLQYCLEGVQAAVETVHSTATDQELQTVQAENTKLKKRLDEMMAQYYRWKLACVFTEDRHRQMAKELQKIANYYKMYNEERVFGLTSWAPVEDLFPEDKMETKVVAGNTVIDWAKSDWDYETEKSSHIDEQQSLLWPRPATFALDGTKCPMCLNFFGPEGGMQLGTCGHLYHPICLISLMITRQRCVTCKAPFHKRLYDLFGLVEHMPPSWEFNMFNAPNHPNRWGEDLVWSWRYKYHSLERTELSSQFGWENNAHEIVRVCRNLIKGSGNAIQGRRNFFYQCFNGHWNEDAQEFRFGPHPYGWTWNKDGVRVADGEEEHHANPGEYEAPGVGESLMLSESEWRERWTEEAIDFLMEQHSPTTRVALQQLQQSQVLRAILEEDGPARRTRSATRQLNLGSSADSVPRSGTHDNEAGPSGTAED